MFDCFGLGIAPADILMQIDKYPEAGVKIDARSIVVQGGGPIPTAMVALARLGMKASLMTAVGRDVFGDFVINELQREKVDTSFIIRKNRPTAIASGWIEKDSGRRTIVLDLDISVNSSDIKLSKLPVARAVHLDGRYFPACLKIARWAQRNKKIVFFDIGSIRNDVSEILPLVDHLVCAGDFAFPYTNGRTPVEVIDKLRKICPGTVVVTSGTKGSTGYDPQSGYINQKAFRVKAVDTTGAGDVYHGAYIFGVLKGWDLEKRLEFSSAAAALKCTRPGGRTGAPNYRQAVNFLGKGRARYA
jgi:ribokinase